MFGNVGFKYFYVVVFLYITCLFFYFSKCSYLIRGVDDFQKSMTKALVRSENRDLKGNYFE